MTTELTRAGTPAAVDVASHFTPEQYELIRSQIAPKATPDEMKLFLYQAARTGLDPLSRQIYAIHRKERIDGEERLKMTIQTSIDGFRLIAERTGRYAPGPETQFTYSETAKDANDEPRVKSATAFVLKRTVDGTWHTVAATAHFWEYAQAYGGKLTKMWEEKPHIMLGKCAEALALRKAFPAEMSGIYTGDEMGKADSDRPVMPDYQPPTPESQAKLDALAAKNAATLAAPRSAPKPAAAPARNWKPEAAKVEDPKGPAASAPVVPVSPAASATATSAPTASASTTSPSTSLGREPGSDDDDETPIVAAAREVFPEAEEFVDCFKQVRGFVLRGKDGELTSIGPEPKRTLEQNAKMHALFNQLRIPKEDVPPGPENKFKGVEGIYTRIGKRFGKSSTTQLSVRECDWLINAMETQIETNRRLHGAGTPAEREAKWRESGLEPRGDGTWGEAPR
jgi:phage recombination protein Bet